MPVAATTAAPWVPQHATLPLLRNAVNACRGCELYLRATQAVFGEGPRNARMILIGEQPGHDEDLSGHPFVGPAGRQLNRALADAELERDAIYITNAVKHFKFEERGKRRLHKKPLASEINACRPWLEAEVASIGPKVIVCLGATASQALFGRTFRLTKQRGVPLEHAWAAHAVATIHPSAILRARDEESRHSEYERFVEDLRTAASLL